MPIMADLRQLAVILKSSLSAAEPASGDERAVRLQEALIAAKGIVSRLEEELEHRD